MLINQFRVEKIKLSNKLCALLSRSEIRDLVDVRALEALGYSLEDAFAAAQQKDRGLTHAQLAWVLQQIELGDDLVPPGDVSRQELQDYLDDFIAHLKKLSFPQPGDSP